MRNNRRGNPQCRDYLLGLTIGELRAFVQGALSVREYGPSPVVHELTAIAHRLDRPCLLSGRTFVRTGTLSGTRT